MKYIVLATAVFCLSLVAAAHIAAKVTPSLVSADMLEQLNSLLIVGLACLALYNTYSVEEMIQEDVQ